MSYLRVNDTTFGRLVHGSSLPVLAVFGTPQCVASRALRAIDQSVQIVVEAE